MIQLPVFLLYNTNNTRKTGTVKHYSNFYLASIKSFSVAASQTLAVELVR